MMNFNIVSFVKEKLAVGTGTVEAVLSVTAQGGGDIQSSNTRKRLGLIIDNSTSMRGNKMSGAKTAARLVVRNLEDGMEFFVMSFGSDAVTVVPVTCADSRTRHAAESAIQNIEANGATYMSKAIKNSRALFADAKGAVCMTVMLTDGENDSDDQQALTRELDLATGMFVCHARGVGDQWHPDQLRLIAVKTSGTAEGIRDAQGLEANFKQILEQAKSMSLADVRLRLRMPGIVQLNAFEQSFPVKLSLKDRMIAVDQRMVEIPLDAWGEGRRDYSASFKVVAQEPSVDGNRLFAPSLVYTDPSTGSPVEIKGNPVNVFWTTNVAETLGEDSTVAHYKGQGEKAAAKQEAAEALSSGDDGRATLRLERVVQMSLADGDMDTIKQIKKIADVDETTGTVKLKRKTNVETFDIMDLNVSSTKTVRAQR